ncbi:MAG: DUF4956 domain-containing protein [Oscillospiraceae bacterium]|nr:DUF4956 domain-containing protein [Ruminococcus sp.]MCD7733469.1 DUF4956 domain-containing protein [Oscillospiraceae bacterium]MCD7805523.1 DUF4956 domain-containing protein [Oscillospiraceae bacterium]
MSSIKAVLKESIEQLGLVEHLTVSYILVTLVCALLCGIVIYFVYKVFYRGAVYSENFAVLIVMITVITAFIVLVIGSNLVLSLGMVGALSIVRFRSAVKDPLDVGFLFWGIASGITSGAGLYPFALIATLGIALVYILFTVIAKGKRTYVLVIRYTSEAEENISEIMNALKAKTLGRSRYQGETELTCNIRLKKKNTRLVDKLYEVDGVISAVMVEYTGQ